MVCENFYLRNPNRLGDFVFLPDRRGGVFMRFLIVSSVDDDPPFFFAIVALRFLIASSFLRFFAALVAAAFCCGVKPPDARGFALVVAAGGPVAGGFKTADAAFFAGLFFFGVFTLTQRHRPLDLTNLPTLNPFGAVGFPFTILAYLIPDERFLLLFFLLLLFLFLRLNPPMHFMDVFVPFFLPDRRRLPPLHLHGALQFSLLVFVLHLLGLRLL